MSSSIEGIAHEISFDIKLKIVQFCVIENSGSQVLCRYNYEDNFPLIKNDRVQCIGDFECIQICNMNYNIFKCSFVTARYDFDLLNFLMTYMPYASKETKLDSNKLTDFYLKTSDKIYEYITLYFGKISPDNLCSLFSSLYSCISVGDEDQLVNFSKFVFDNTNTKPLKHFLKMWNNDVLIRPLQLLGLSEKEIHAIHIPLNAAYTIVKTNPYRLPQYSNDKAAKIMKSHLRLGFSKSNEITNHRHLTGISLDAVFCGEISRMVYDNLHTRKWTSTPICLIRDKYPNYDSLKDTLEKYYFCIEDMDHLYFKPLYYIEKNVSAKIAELIQKPPRDLQPAVFPGVRPSEKQQEAVNMMLTKGISKLTGGPGTGKTITMSQTINNIHMNKEKVLCMSYTGAATSRIRSTTMEFDVFDKCDIMTIHMAIAMKKYICDSKFNYIIIDEFSMVDLQLLAEFISVYKDLEYQIVLIGDVNQLEPIKYGNVLYQLLRVPIPTVDLKENFRSIRAPTVVNICREIVDQDRIRCRRNVNWRQYIVKQKDLDGQIVLTHQYPDDYRFMIGDINYLQQCIAYYANSFQYDETKTKEENFDNFAKYTDMFTIICPYVKIVDQINPIFQHYFMSHITEFTVIGGLKFYLGDRVMKLINDYEIKVMNGEKGKVVAINKSYIVCEFRKNSDTRTPYIERSRYLKMKEFVKLNRIKLSPFKKLENGEMEKMTQEEIKVEVDKLKKTYLYDNIINEETEIIQLYFHLLELYPFSMSNVDNDHEFCNIKNISLGYALTTHKSQGDEFENVIYFICGKYNFFTTLNNVYTGLSRSKLHLDIITESEELLNRICLTKIRNVYDKLGERIRSLLPVEYFNTEIMEDIINDNEICYDDDDDYDFDDEANFGVSY